jgi:hypothetical protein
MLRVISLFTLLASANVFAIGDSNITLSDGVLVTDHFRWDIGDEWEIDSARDSGFNDYDKNFSVYLRSGESTIQISLSADDLISADDLNESGYSDNLVRGMEKLIPDSEDTLMHSEYFLTNDLSHSGVLERYRSSTNKYYTVIDATTTGFDGNSSNQWVNFSAIIEGDNLILADVVELIKRVDFLEDPLGHFSIPAVANLDDGESNVTYHVGETNLELTPQGLRNEYLSLPLYNFEHYEEDSWEELSMIDDQNQTTATLSNKNGDILTFNDFGDVSMYEYLDAHLDYELSQTTKKIENSGLFLTNGFEVGYGIHLSEDQNETTQHEYIFVIDTGQDEDANTWRFIEIRLFSSALSFHDAYEMFWRTENNYSPSINSIQNKALVNLLTSMVAPLDDLDSTKPKVLKFTTEDIIDITSNSDPTIRVGITSTVFAIPLILDPQISLRFRNLNDAVLSLQNGFSFDDSNITKISSFVTDAGSNAYTFEVSTSRLRDTEQQKLRDFYSLVNLSSANLIAENETTDLAVIYHWYEESIEEELSPYLNETLSSILVTSFEENVDEPQEEVDEPQEEVDEPQEEVGKLPDTTEISLLEVVEDGPISFSIPADLNVSNTISFKLDPFRYPQASYTLNSSDLYSSPSIYLELELVDAEALDYYLKPTEITNEYTIVDTFRSFITSNNYEGNFNTLIESYEWLDEDRQTSHFLLIFDQQEIMEKLPDGTALLASGSLYRMDENVSSSTLLAIADSIKINPDKIPAFLDPLDQESGELPDISLISLPKEIVDGPVKFSVPADVKFSVPVDRDFDAYPSPFYIEPDQSGLLAYYNLNNLSISLQYSQNDLKDEMFKILQRPMNGNYSISLNQSFITSNNYNGHITEVNSSSGDNRTIIVLDITSDEIISKIPQDSKLILTAQSYGVLSNDILMAVVNSFQLDPSLSIQVLQPPLALNSKFTDGPITICLPEDWIVDTSVAYYEREISTVAQYAFYNRKTDTSTGIFLNIFNDPVAKDLDDWGAQALYSYEISQLNRGPIASNYITSNNQLYQGISVSRHYPTLLSNLGLLGLSSDFWIGMDITTSEWKERHMLNEYAKGSDWLKAFIWGNTSQYYNTALEIIKCLEFNNSNYQDIPPFKENNSTVGTYNNDGIPSPINDKIIENPQSNPSDSLPGYAPDSISGFSLISTGSDGTKYDPLVFSDYGIASREYADRNYQYEKTSSNQGKITYSFTEGDDKMPEVTIITFSSLNEGTYSWTEYSDSALQNPLDTDQGSWKMIPGYERTADSQNPDLAPDSLAGLLAEYISTNDSSSEIIYFSNTGSATTHYDGRMYSYEKTSDIEGIITYSFENEAVPIPQITNISFTSLNEGTFIWTEYSDSTLTSVLDTDSGTWVMTTGYDASGSDQSNNQIPSSGKVMSKWKQSGWMGVFFDASDGWIYHPDLGWLYAEDSSADKTWLYASDKGWLWTSKDVYPYIYSDDSSNWIYIVKEEDTPTKAYDYNPGQWSLWQDLMLLKIVNPSPNSSAKRTDESQEIEQVIHSQKSDRSKLNEIAEIIKSNL